MTLRPFGGIVVFEEERALVISGSAALDDEMLAREGSRDVASIEVRLTNAWSGS